MKLRFENTLRATITKGRALKVSALLDYDREPPHGVEEEDLLFIVALESVLKQKDLSLYRLLYLHS